MRAQKWFGLGLGGAIMVLTLSLGAQRGEHVVERLLTTTDRATFDRARGELLSQWGSTMAGWSAPCGTA